MQIEQKNVKRANIFNVFFRISQTIFTQKEKNVLKHNFTTKKSETHRCISDSISLLNH